MIDSRAPPRAPSGRFLQGLAVGLAAGVAIGYGVDAWWRAGELAPAAGGDTAPAPAPPTVRITLGHGHLVGDNLRYPVAIVNFGPARDLITVTCGFYDKSGALLDNGVTNFSDVAAGASAQGAFYVSAERADRYVCSSS